VSDARAALARGGLSRLLTAGLTPQTQTNALPIARLRSFSWVVAAAYFLATRSWLDPWTLLFVVPVVVSVLIPPIPTPNLLATPFFKNILKYVDFEEVLETTDEELEVLTKDRNYIYATQPHGVMSVAGVAYAIHSAPRSIPPTAAASVILSMPILKHVFGMFHLVDASKRQLVKVLKRPFGRPDSSVVVYIGGMAELFLSHHNVEHLYIKKRKGFIKLAMQTGADVIPLYFFGNTSTLDIVRNRFLQEMSRRLGISITLMWGRWGLPIPLPRKVLCIRGRPLGLPQKAEPTQEDIDKFHDLYCKQVQDIYEKYREKVGGLSVFFGNAADSH
jgi:hypothetical protein